MIEILTKSEDYVGDEIDDLDEKITKCYAILMKIAGMKGCTNVEFFQKMLDHEGVVRLWSDQEEKCPPLIV
jgi:hypothetical protein